MEQRYTHSGIRSLLLLLVFTLSGIAQAQAPPTSKEDDKRRTDRRDASEVLPTQRGGGPANNDCASAVSLTVNEPGACPTAGVAGDNGAATQDGDDPECDGTDTQFQDVWYTFNSGPYSVVTISFTDVAMEDIIVEVLVGGCGGTTVFCDFEEESYQVSVDPGTDHVLRVASNNDFGDGGAFTICLTGTGMAGDYCVAGATSTSFEKIANITFADIDNSSTATAGYEDFTSVEGNVEQEGTYAFTATLSNGDTESQVYVWVDLDQNNEFSENELLFTSALGPGPHTGNITFPADAALGSTRMRVRLLDMHDGTNYSNIANNTPCGNSTFGQVEDYTLNIGVFSSIQEQEAGMFSVFPNPGNGDFFIRHKGMEGRVTVELLDMTGRLVYSDIRAMAGAEQVLLPLAGRLVAGTYLLRLIGDQGSLEQRLVVR
jgi:hypothetical protein